jgi:mRNA-degrading endonuclease toxin of MazEF toxin-antitoxin module
MRRPGRTPPPEPDLGRIVEVRLHDDTQGNFGGIHPAVILTKRQDIVRGAPIRVCVISTKLQHALKRNMVELPYTEEIGHPITQLKKRCAAICEWAPEIKKDDILSYRGIVPDHLLDEIQHRLRALGEETQPGASQP